VRQKHNELNKPNRLNKRSQRPRRLKSIRKSAPRPLTKGEIVWETREPDGQPRRMLDVSKAEREFGFKAETSFEEGLKKTIDWYVKKRQAN
jgi:GDP-L-fucose synthase